jgi:cytochrome P450 family 6
MSLMVSFMNFMRAQNNLIYNFLESLRKYPPALNALRRAINEYKIPNTKHTIPAGMQVVIPTMSIQNDERYWDKPEEFRPERFTPEEIQKRPSCTFMPFGEGPRNCIGMRYKQLFIQIQSSLFSY